MIKIEFDKFPLNQNNDCKFYKKVWYKFFIRTPFKLCKNCEFRFVRFPNFEKKYWCFKNYF